MAANEQYKPPTPKVRRQPGLSIDDAEKIIKRKLAEGFGEVRKAFRSLDDDKSGSIGVSEFRRLLERYGIQMEDGQLQQLFNRFDPDGGGEVDYEEFLRYFGSELQGKEEGGFAVEMQLYRPVHASGYNDKVVPQKGLKAPEVIKILGKKISEQFAQVQKAFRSLDADYSGCIGADEFRRLLTRYNLHMEDSDFYPWFASLDPDGSGELAYDEFIAIFGADIAGSSGEGAGSSILEANAAYRPPTPKGVPHKGLDADIAEAVLKEKIADQFHQCAKAFRSFDYDKSGSVERPEFRKLLERFCIYMKDSEFEKLFRRFDPDDSGELEYPEFLRYFGGGIAGGGEGGIGMQLAAQADFRDKLRSKETPFIREDPKSGRIFYCGPSKGGPERRGNTPRPGTMSGMRPASAGTSRPATARPSTAGSGRPSTAGSRRLSSARTVRPGSAGVRAGPGQAGGPPPGSSRGPGLSVQGSGAMFVEAATRAGKLGGRPASARTARSHGSTSYGERVRQGQNSRRRATGTPCRGSWGQGKANPEAWWESPNGTAR